MKWSLVLLLAAVSMTARAQYALGHFSAYEVHKVADAVAIGDVNADGLDDIVLTTKSASIPDPQPNYVYVFVQNPNGLLATPTRYVLGWNSTASALALADMDNDGIKDIIVGNGAGISARLTASPRARQARYGSGSAYWALKTLDVDMDGNTDIVAWGGTGRIFFGDGHGGIRDSRPLAMPAGAAHGEDLEVGDLNGDGFPDLAYGRYGVPFSIRFNDRAGGFRDPVAVGQTDFDGFALGDFNHDNRLDIAGSDISGPIMLLQQPDEVFQSARLPGWDPYGGAMTSADLDGNGLDDLLIAQSNGSQVDYYMQAQGGLQTPAVASLPGYTTLGHGVIATGDLNHDGCTDVAVASNSYGLYWMYGQGCGATVLRKPHRPALRATQGQRKSNSTDRSAPQSARSPTGRNP
jgi:hypothetical protein